MTAKNRILRGGEMTVLDLVKKYLSQKTGVRHNTEANYNFVLNIIKKEDFGRQRADRVKLSDAKCWLIKLQQDGRGYSSIHSIRGVVRPAFQMAVDDDLIRKNPFEFQLATVVVNDSVTAEGAAFCTWTRTASRWLRFTGNITSSTSARSTTASTRRGCPKSPRTFAGTHSVPTWQRAA